MTAELKLSDKPKWWVVKVLKVLSFASALLSVVLFAAALLFNWYAARFNAAQEAAMSGADNVSIDAIDFFYQAAHLSFGLFAYVFVCWILALIVDKIDQLVWLNATNEDRLEIIQSRQSKRGRRKSKA